MSNPIIFAGPSISRDEDFPINERPTDPDMRDGINIWLFEKNGEFAIPRLAVDAVGPNWDIRSVWSTVVFPDGRLLQGVQNYPAIPTDDEQGRPTILGSTALKFRCIEPMGKWLISYEDELTDGDSASQIAGMMNPERRAKVRLEAEIVLRTPLWSQFFADDDPRPEAGWMGRGWRYEVPCDVSGTFEVDGTQRSFSGMGYLIRRKSKRAHSKDFPGHCWLAAGFPDGRAFGCNIYPKQEGREQYNTGYLHKDGKTYDAKVIEAPWLKDMNFKGEDMSVVLETELGLTRIRGESLLSSFKPGFGNMGGLNLNQGGVRFTWDDQTTIGMTERSSFF